MPSAILHTPKMFSGWAALLTFLLLPRIPVTIPTGSQTTASFGSLPYIALDTEGLQKLHVKEIKQSTSKACHKYSCPSVFTGYWFQAPQSIPESGNAQVHYINGIVFAYTLHTFSHILYFILFLATLHGMWNLSSPTRDQTCAPYIGSMES